MRPGTVLNKAADLIVERGHSKHAYVSPDGSVCALGAIMITCGAKPEPALHRQGYVLRHNQRTREDYWESEAARQLLRDFLNERADQYGWHSISSIPEWNDESDAERVIHAMRAAAMCDEDGE